MQLIRPLPIDVERYVAEEYHRKIRPPEKCPHCGKINSLWAHGYYDRHLSRLVHGVITFWIRRFRCRSGCGVTVSILPAFAQPYRIVRNETIQQFFRGAPYDPSVVRWLGVLNRYRRKFVRWLPEILRIQKIDPNRAPPDEKAALEWCRRRVAEHGSFGGVTLVFVSVFRITLFGRYQCHRPNPALD